MSDMSNIWSQSSCLTKNQLIGYIQHTLESEEEYLIESHLNDCPFCNDALEGLMYSDLDKTEQHLTALKTDFHEKLHKLDQEKSKPKPLYIEPKVNELKPEAKTSSRKISYRWLYAASVLLIVGLGYSVYSFIQKSKPNAVAQKVNPKISNANAEYKPVKDKSNELIQLEVRPEDISPLPEMTTKNTEIESKNYKQKETKSVLPSETIVRNSPIQTTQKREESKLDNPVPQIQEKENGGSDAIENDESLQNYAKEERVSNVDATKYKKISDKKSTVGLSKNATPTIQSPSSNQMNYSSNNNKKTLKKEIQQLSESLSEEYNDALAQYNKGNYRKSIRQFEKLLSSSNGEMKEDIIYYLAMANMNSGKEDKANLYFAELKNSAKYKSKILQTQRAMKK
jgi:hypothetical protein